jgi:hypothetical protein
VTLPPTVYIVLIYTGPALSESTTLVARLVVAAAGPAFFALVSLLITPGITAVPTPTTIATAVRIARIKQTAASLTLGGGCFYSEDR